jgi:Ca-activated chloride channel family protein
LVLLTASLAVAQQPLTPQPGNPLGRRLHLHAANFVVPQARSFRGTSRAEPIRIEKVQARVKILEGAASTRIVVTLRNPGRRPTEAVLLLPVPDGAAVHSFDFLGKAAEPTAQLLSKAEARRIYDSIVRRSRDPALLEFAGFNVVRTSVFPVPAGGVQKVALTYNHVLPTDGNRLDYVLPRSESLDVATPWEIEVDIKSKNPVATVYSPSHELVVQRHDPRHLTLKVKAAGRLQPGAFRLSALLERNGVAASLFAYPDPAIGGGYFLLLAGIPTRISKDTQRLKREVTLVIDRSGSMAGGLLDQVRVAAKQIIGGLEPGESFNIIDYSTAVALFSPKPVPANPENRKRANAYLDALRSIGGTNIHDALVEALRQPPSDGKLPIVLFLTDGLPTIGRTSEVEIRNLVLKGNPHKRRIFTFGVGNDVNVPLLDRISEESRGVPTYITPGEDVELKVAKVFKRLYGPVLAATKLVTLNGDKSVDTTRIRERVPATLPDLFEGDQLVVMGQYRGADPLRFNLKGTYLQKPRTFAFEFDLKNATTRNAFVPRLWATRRIAYLVDAIRQAGAAAAGRPATVGESIFNDPKYKELTQEILRLSTRFGVLSEYTAFLAREGTDLAQWDRLVTVCSGAIDGRAVRTRWGGSAVSQGRNFESAKKRKSLDYYNGFLNEKLQRVEVSGVQQISSYCLWLQKGKWVDGRLVAGQNHLKPDLTIKYGTPQYAALLTQLVSRNEQALIARKGEILLQHEGKTLLVQNIFAPAPVIPPEGKSNDKK